MTNNKQIFRETWVEVNLDAIAKNISNLKSYLPSDVAIFAAVKANGYGHGAVQVAKVVLENGAEYLATASLDEALNLRENNIEAPILVLGTTSVSQVSIAAKYNITLTAFDKKWILAAIDILKSEKLQLKIHIKIDTGMGRLGVRTTDELSELIQLFCDNHIELEGVFTHFSTADVQDKTHYMAQLNTFEEFLSTIKVKLKYVHCSNSASCMRYPDSHYSAIRFGVGIYGVNPTPEVEFDLPFELETAFSFHTTIAHVKEVPAGTKISYGATYETTKSEWVATIPVGYADGWLRKLQGQEVLVDGIRVPIVGRICMDQCVIKLPYEIPVGTTVTLLGKNGDDIITLGEIENKLDTLDTEVLCGISNRVPRVFIKNGKVDEVSNALLSKVYEVTTSNR